MAGSKSAGCAPVLNSTTISPPAGPACSRSSGSNGASDGGWFSHTTSNNTCHSGGFNNGATTVTGIGRYYGPLGTVVPTNWVNRGSEIPRIPIQIGVLAGTYWGQLREMLYTSDSSTGLTWRYLGVEQGYIAAYHPTTTGDSLFLKV